MVTGDTLEVAPGAEFEATLQAYTGLLATLRFTLVDPTDGSVEIPETGVGITEPILGLYVIHQTAPLVEDRYQIVWTGFPEAPATQELEVTKLPSTRPTVGDVAKLLRARTKGAGGLTPGTFDATTEPTGEQVDGLIDMAFAYVIAALEVDSVPERHRAAVRFVVTIRTAMLVELSYYPEQVTTEASVYEALKALFDEELKALHAAIQDVADGDSPDSAIGMPSGIFPCAIPLEW